MHNISQQLKNGGGREQLDEQKEKNGFMLYTKLT